jgi:hypothetical protein
MRRRAEVNWVCRSFATVAGQLPPDYLSLDYRTGRPSQAK